MKKTLLTLVALCACASMFAQTHTCIIPPMSAERYNQLKATAPLIQNYAAARKAGALRNVSLSINIMVYANGPITTINKVQSQIDTANLYFANAGIEFSICHVNYIVNTNPMPYWDFTYEYQLGAIYDLLGMLNIYYVDYVINASAYAYYPFAYSPDRIIMGQNLSGKILAHELGHSFNLIHTHGNYNVGNGTDELVNGSNCSTAADLICDTPADPNLYVQNRVDSLCNYTDTITTDSLGFLYHPDTRNIMSYSRLICFDHFTAGQYNRIAYTMAHERAYLKSGEQFVATINAPVSACIYDAPLTLTGNPAGGTFTGTGVSGNQFDPAVAGPGTHIVTYAAPGVATNAESTDQYYQYSDTIYNVNTAWQSFTAAAAENLLAVSFSIKSSVAQPVYITVHDSVGTAGTALLLDTVNIIADSVFNWNKLSFQLPLHLDAGDKYTVAVTMATAIDFAGNKNNVYPAGETNVGNDLSFITHVLTDFPVCGNNAFAAIHVSDPPAPAITNLYPVYCSNAPAQPVNAVPGGGTFTIDGAAQTSIDPFALGAGNHVLHYTYTNSYGCTNDSIFSFTVNDTTAITSNIDSVVCTNDNLINLTGQPSGGVFYLDNTALPVAQIDPATITPGAHTVSYVYDAAYAWIDTIDQDNYFSISNSSYGLTFGQTAWQSFTAGQKGYLNLIDFGLYIGDTTTAVYNLYSGEGTSGTLLYSDTVMITNTGTYEQWFTFPQYQLLLQKDSLYTFEMGINPIVTNSILYDDSLYAGGNAHLAIFGLPETDFKFRTHINSVYQCGADSVARLFILAPAPIVNLGPDITTTAGQVILLDAGNNGSSYIWSTGDTTQQINISGPAGSNVIYVSVIAANGCEGTDTVVVNYVTGVEEINNGVTLLPNPVADVLLLHSRAVVKEVTIVDALGQQIIQHTGAQQQGNLQINTSGLATGVYIVHIRLGERVMVQRFVKQ